MIESSVPVERFCAHHNISDFDCGREDFNEELQGLQDRFSQGHPDIVFVASPGDLTVHGYVALRDIVVKTMRHRERFLYIARLGIDESHKNSNVTMNLVSTAYHIYDLLQGTARESGTPYYGVVVNSYGDPTLEGIFSRHGYRPMAAYPGYWWIRNPRRPRSG